VRGICDRVGAALIMSVRVDLRVDLRGGWETIGCTRPQCVEQVAANGYPLPR
jgi:hypothetical protein